MKSAEKSSEIKSSEINHQKKHQKLIIRKIIRNKIIRTIISHFIPEHGHFTVLLSEMDEYGPVIIDLPIEGSSKYTTK